MARIMFFIGVFLLILLLFVVASSQFTLHGLQALWGQLLSIAPEPADQSIRALPSTPSLAPPLWLFYVGPVCCLLIALIMFRRCHRAGHCRFWAHHQPRR